MLTDDEIEYWFTANGNHIPVKKGQSNDKGDFTINENEDLKNQINKME